MTEGLIRINSYMVKRKGSHQVILMDGGLPTYSANGKYRKASASGFLEGSFYHWV